MERDEERVQREAKELVKSGHRSSATMMVKQLVTSRKHRERMLISKAHLHSMEMQLGNMAAMSRVAGTFAKSTEIMKSMGMVMKVRELSSTMRDMQRQMLEMGIIEEMIDDTMTSTVGDDVEEMADEEIDKV